MPANIGPNIGLYGADSYKRDLQMVTEATKAFKAELDGASKIKDPIAQSNAQWSALASEIDAQREKVLLLGNAYNHAASTYGEFSKEAFKAQGDLEKAKTALQAMVDQFERLSTTTVRIPGVGELKRDMDTLTAATTTFRKEYEMFASGSGLSGVFQRASGMQTSLVNEINTQVEKVKLLREEYDKAAINSGSFSQAALEMRGKLAEATTELQRMYDELKKLPNGLQLAGQEMINVGNSVSGVGRNIQTAARTFRPLTAAVGAAFTGIIKESADFEKQMSVNAAVMGLDAANSAEDAAEKQKLIDKARELGRTTIYSAVEAAEAMEVLGRAGLRAEESIAVIDSVLNMAIADGMDFAEAASIMVDNLNALGMDKDVANAARIVDVLSQTSRNANTNISEMGQAMKYAAPTFSSVGWSIEDMALAMGLAADFGVKGSQAGTGLRQAIKNLVAPSGVTEAALEKFGITLDDGTGNVKSFAQFLSELRSVFGDVAVSATDSMGELKEYEQIMEEIGDSLPVTQMDKLQGIANIFGTRALPTILALIQTGEEDFYDLASAIDSAGGSAQEMADIIQDNLTSDWDYFIDEVKGLALEFGDVLLPVVRQLLQQFTEWIHQFNNLDDSTKKTIIKAALLAAAIYPVGTAIGGVVRGIGGVIKVGGFLVKGTGGLIKLLTGGAGLVHAAGSVGGALTNLGGAAPAAAGGFAKLAGAITGGGGAGGGLMGALSAAKAGLAAFGPTGVVVAGITLGAVAIYKNLDNIKDAFERHGKGLGGIAAATWEAIHSPARLTMSAIDKLTGTHLASLHDKWVHFTGDLIASAFTWGRDLLNTMTAGIEAGIDWLREKLGKVANTIRRFLHFSTPDEGPLKDADTYMPDMMRLFASGIERNTGLIERASGLVATLLRNPVVETVGQMFGFGENASGRFGSGILSNIGAVRQSGESIGSAVLGAFASVSGKAKAWGADIGSMLASGIASTASKVASAASSVASKIKSLLHFSVPDEGPLADADTYMPDFMKLLAGGMTRNLPMVERAAGKVAAAISPNHYAYLPETSGGVARTTNMGGVTIVINAAPGMDPQEIADAVEERLIHRVERQEYAYA